ncbi:MAG: RDD family protein, partial [Planctomycetota bacterium]
WIAVFVGRYHDKQWNDYLGEIVIISPLVVLGAIALIQILGLTFRSTASHSIFRLAVINDKGRRADRLTLLRRWAIVWLPLFVPMSFVALLIKRAEVLAFIWALVLFLIWIGAAVYAVIVPNRGLHDRLAGTWVVRQ